VEKAIRYPKMSPAATIEVWSLKIRLLKKRRLTRRVPADSRPSRKPPMTTGLYRGPASRKRNPAW